MNIMELIISTGDGAVLKSGGYPAKKNRIKSLGGYYDHELRTSIHGTRKMYEDYLFRRWLLWQYYSGGSYVTAYKRILKAETMEEVNAIRDEIVGGLIEKAIRPDEEQLIPSEYWADPYLLEGCNLQQLFHPHWRLAWDLLNERYKPRSENLFIATCGGSKPYSQSMRFANFMRGAKAGFYDMLIASLYPVPVYPLDASSLYPYTFSEWPHPDSDKLVETRAEVHARYLAEFLKKHKYKTVVYTHNGTEYHNIMADYYRKYAPEGCKIINLATDTNLLDVIEAKHPVRTKTGINKMRHYSLKITRQYVCRAFGNPPGLADVFRVKELH